MIQRGPAPYPPPPPPPPPPRPVAPDAPADRRATWATAAAIAGVGVGLAGVVAGGLVLATAGGNVAANYVLETPFLNAFGIGIVALVLGPAAYFLARSAPGRPAAGPAAIIGIAATIVGAASTLLWLVIMLLGYFGAPPSQ